MSDFVKWVISTSVIVGFTLFGLYMGALEWVLSMDHTYISVAIVALYYYTTFVLGFRLFKEEYLTKGTDFFFYMCTVFTTLGLLGTIIGLLQIPAQIATAQAGGDLQPLLIAVATSLGTAFMTTLVGFVASLVVYTQMALIGYYSNE